MTQQHDGPTRFAHTGQFAAHHHDLQQQIAERAYQLFQLRGGSHGSDVEDWLAAEREVLATRRGRPSSTPRRPQTNGRAHPRSKPRKAA
ncbi:MAG: DUF2934 domain-containing protein [Nitrospirota bacterium]